MQKTIRILTPEDSALYEKMDTGMDDDYMVQAFTRLTKKSHRLYGLFVEEELATVGGFSVYGEQYAMLGRLRSSIHYRGKGFAAELMQFVLEEALKLDQIHWAGAITEEKNKPAQRVIQKMGLKHYTTLYPATADNVAELNDDGASWTLIDSLNKKKEWLKKTYLQTGEIFPYECYYPFPASDSLFTDKNLLQWEFYENKDQSRFFIAKHDIKGTHYCQIIYPWSDFSKQEGFWASVHHTHQKLSSSLEEEVEVWMDLTKEETAALPSTHPFNLPSPWMVFGTKSV